MIHGLIQFFRPLSLALQLGLALFWLAAWPGPAGAAPLVLDGGRKIAAAHELRLVLSALSGERTNVIALQRELISRAAVPPEQGGAGEEEKARWIETWLAARGIPFERLDLPDERVPSKVRPNLVVVYPTRNAEPGEPTLWLFSHLDVAAAGPRELWNGDPFALRVEGNILRGRGVEDNNQAIVSSLLLLESLHKTGATPPRRLGLVLTSAALTDYSGIKNVLAKKPDLVGPGDFAVVLDYGNPAGSLVSVGEKGNLWLKITVTGKSGHAGRPNLANNPFAAGAALAAALPELERRFAQENPLFSPPRTTIIPTRTENFSTGINHIPEKFVFYIDARVTEAYSFEEVENALREQAAGVEKAHGVSIAFERIDATPSTRFTPRSAPVLVALDRAIRAELGVEPEYKGAGSVTVAGVLREKGLHVAVWGVQETMHNRPEEYALISAHIKQAQVLARMLFDTPSVQSANRSDPGEKTGKRTDAKKDDG